MKVATPKLTSIDETSSVMFVYLISFEQLREFFYDSKCNSVKRVKLGNARM